MIVYGYAKQHRYCGDGTLQIQVRIPTIHGPYSMKEYHGKKVKNYVPDGELPYYTSLLLPHMPNDGEVVALSSMSDSSIEFIVIGMTGGFYTSVNADVGGK